jgi:zinc/manganese transport system permease protein
MLSSLMPEAGEARGVRTYRMEMYFLVIVALATTLSIPVVGALLMFTLMVGPPAAARSFTSKPFVAMGLSIAIALLTVWISLAASYRTSWPVSFFVGSISAALYTIGRCWSWWSGSRTLPPAAEAA